MVSNTILGALFFPIIVLGGCSFTYVPQVQEVWEGVDVNGEMEFKIKEKIFCETVHALKFVRKYIRVNGQPSIPDDYGVQMQITLTVEEVGALNPSVGSFHVLPNAVRDKVNVPQSFALNGSATLSRDATRVDTSYSYYNVGRIAGEGKNTFCDKLEDFSGSSPLLHSDLGIQDYLRVAVKGADVFHSSPPARGGFGKTTKLDVYSYDVKFVVVTSASINPIWKLVNINTGIGNLPLANISRTRTHDLTLTFGPGVDRPADFAQQTHFTGRIVQSNQQKPLPE